MRLTAGRRPLVRLEVPFGVFGAALIALAFVFAATGIPRWIPPALLVRLGLPSPLTGMTRSFVTVASGDLLRAFAAHPLGPPLFVFCLALPVIAACSWARGRRLGVLTRLVGRT